MASMSAIQETVEEAVQAVTDSILDRGPDKFTEDDIVAFYVGVCERLLQVSAERRERVRHATTSADPATAVTDPVQGQ